MPTPAWVTLATWSEFYATNQNPKVIFDTVGSDTFYGSLSGEDFIAQTLGGLEDFMRNSAVKSITGDFMFEAQIVIRDTGGYVTYFNANLGGSGWSISVVNNNIGWGKTGAGSFTENVVKSYAAGQLVKVRIKRISGTVSADYDDGGGWTAFTNTTANSDPIVYIGFNSSGDPIPGVIYALYEADSGLVYPRIENQQILGQLNLQSFGQI